MLKLRAYEKKSARMFHRSGIFVSAFIPRLERAVFQLHSAHEEGQRLRREGEFGATVARRWPREAALLETLGEDPHSGAVPMGRVP